MYDPPHPCYLGQSQQGKLKPLNQNFHDINHTCEHDFIDLEHLSRFPSHIWIAIIFRHSPFDVDFVTFFLNDAMMMICKMWVKPFDVLMIRIIANMTSVGCATQLVDE